MTLSIVCFVVVSSNEFVKSRNSKQQIHRKHFLLKNKRVFIRQISFVNNGWRELKETPSSNWKIPCQTVIFGVSEKRPSSN
ncbi:hypothetical protein T03_18009 [Trichinella britovi]|uniref:Uncharacterized protein n=1 Tax=Trichinella britovi TaxID=45882 RepID=A0A0V1BES2_TRIBR|nr:hypothetical protein T03_18009 [Trichinella britovi]